MRTAPIAPDDTAISASAGIWRDGIVRMAAGALETLLDRQREMYPFIDTKTDVATGFDFEAGDALRGPETVYTWIQGRGLEALAEHGRWLMRERKIGDGRKRRLLEGISSVIPQVIRSMEIARRRNGGRLPFMMTTAGEALTVTDAGTVVPAEAGEAGRAGEGNSSGSGAACSLSDLFYAKGLMAAATFAGDAVAAREAEALFAEVIADLRRGRFRFGQVALDPKNPVREVPGRFSHAGRMIGIGAATVFWRCTGEARYRELGLEFVRWILERHVQTAAATESGAGVPPASEVARSSWPWTDQQQNAAGLFPVSAERQHSRARMPVPRQNHGLEARATSEAGRPRHFLDGDFWEFTDTDDAPWATPEGRVWSDPGHATEFAGLAFAHLRETGIKDAGLEACLRSVLRQNFANGFSDAGFGIVKSYDLAARRPINRDMPWWSLPETMRASALGAMTAGDSVERTTLEDIFRKCHDVFVTHYLRPERGFMAVPCLDAQGRISAAIPATPDADPCYHTGLSLLGCLPWLESNG
ncbi:N-acyl-D-glucosamine 2-epimerase [Opitutaceae bacterium TAV1]|nr:N-acyl-D-glucosamine 2-epimerase [Opitutaceae bacterium TAV1]